MREHMCRQLLRRKHPMLCNVEVTKRRRRDVCDDGLEKPFVAKKGNNRGARSRTEKYGRNCTLLG